MNEDRTTAMSHAPTSDAPELDPAGISPPPPLTQAQRAAVIGAGVVAAIALPDHEPGLGLAVTWVAIVAAVLLTRPSGTWAGAWRRSMIAVAALAAGLPAWSDAGWVVAPALLVAVGVAVLGFAGGATWLGMVRPALRCVPVGFGSFGAVAAGLRDALPTDVRRHPGVRATLLTIVLLGVFGALFASADRLFGRLVERFLVPDLDLGLFPVRAFVAVLVTVGAATLVRLRARARDDRPVPAPSRHLRGIEWQVPLGALVLLFAGFVALQFGVLFGGHERVLATAGLTYAEYARGGFAQLVAVAVLTLVVIAATGRYAAAGTLREVRVRRGLLAGLCLLTLVVLLSAHHRLSLYEDAFGFTRLRFAATAVIVWLAVVFFLVLAAGATRKVGLLPRALALVTALAVSGIGYLQPDARIAEWNVERYLAEGRIDVDYLADLSADAVPALLELPDEVRGCVLGPHVVDLVQGADGRWPAWSMTRARAERLLEAHGPLPACGEAARGG
ncbi:DUF4153 domain-containing protein [Egicoccus sp. AB-alg6-2]|uniref:DUF4153 domain-containing protein n=1 Tax=Egicoccus sp. AB-alg6-2 TaxID=3242692 RepID=UPI00359D5DA8